MPLEEQDGSSATSPVGGMVRRRTGPWTTAVHGLLDYLEGAGFPSPRVVRAEKDIEVLTWLPGHAGAAGWGMIVSDDGLGRWGAFVRAYHDTIASYRPSGVQVWSSGPGSCGPDELICHGDLWPGNTVGDGHGEPAGLIDWDHVRPAPALFDIAYALEYAAPVRPDDEAIQWLGHPHPPNRLRRIQVFCEAYGRPVPDDVKAVVAAQQRQTRQTVVALATQGVEPQRSWVADGYLDVLGQRIRWTESLTL